MTKYSVSVTAAVDEAKLMRLIRTVSTLGISEIAKRIGTSAPVVEFDTWNFPIEMGHEEEVAYQQEIITAFLAALTAAGGTIVVQHHTESFVESVSPEMLNNLFESERIYLAQEHD